MRNTKYAVEVLVLAAAMSSVAACKVDMPIVLP
jgi:hypothetical protein